MKILIGLLIISVFIIIRLLMSLSDDKYYESMLKTFKVTVKYKVHYSSSESKEYTKEFIVRNKQKENIRVETSVRASRANILSIYWTYTANVPHEIRIEETTAPIEIIEYSAEEVVEEA